MEHSGFGTINSSVCLSVRLGEAIKFKKCRKKPFSKKNKTKNSDFDMLSLSKNEIGVLISFVCYMSTKERYHGFWLVHLWPGKEEDFLDASQFHPMSKWKELWFSIFPWIKICCGFALILLVWIEKDYSFCFWSVSDKSQFTLTLV